MALFLGCRGGVNHDARAVFVDGYLRACVSWNGLGPSQRWRGLPNLDGGETRPGDSGCKLIEELNCSLKVRIV